MLRKCKNSQIFLIILTWFFSLCIFIRGKWRPWYFLEISGLLLRRKFCVIQSPFLPECTPSFFDFSVSLYTSLSITVVFWKLVAYNVVGIWRKRESCAILLLVSISSQSVTSVGICWTLGVFHSNPQILTWAFLSQIPFYPVVKKDLTFIHLGNDSKIESLVNFEKLRMIAKEVRTLSNMCSSPYDLLTMLELGGQPASNAMVALNQLTTANSQHHSQGLFSYMYFLSIISITILH